ncbi:MAG: ATP-dependent helicase [Actinobacteria bacterium]|nr:MAG: ATP-dependent helicase [Actinomycetota bacterium]
MVYVVHVHWRPAGVPTEDGAALFWAESLPAKRVKRSALKDHPFCADAGVLGSWLGAGEADTLEVLLPGNDQGPFASVDGTSGRRKVALRPWRVPALRLAPTEAVPVLMQWLDAERIPQELRLGDSVRYWQQAAQLALEALAGQRLIPGLERLDGRLYARWRPSLDGHRLRQLGEAMPPVCRALVDPSAGPQAEGDLAPEALLRDFLEQTCDALARAWTSAPGPLREISGLDASQPGSEPGLRWARALFGTPRPIAVSEAQAQSLERSHRLWLRNLSVAGDEHFRVAFRLSEPDPNLDGNSEEGEGVWSLEFLLQAQDDPSLLLEVAAIRGGGEALGGVRRLTEPHEKLLRGLGYASRLFAPLEYALQQSSIPEAIELDANEAFCFMRESAPLLEEGGFGVLIPSWWSRSSSRLGLKARVSSKSASDGEGSGMMGLANLLDYQWELSLGGHTLSKEEFETLAALKSPLVRVRGEWVRLDPDQVEKALRFFTRKERDGTREGELDVVEALSLGLGGVEEVDGLEVEDVDFEAGLGEWFESLSGERKLESLPVPESLRAELRPYQTIGYSWLEFLRSAGLGACLADDMGLGKTVQTLALLSRDQEHGRLRAPVLIVCPTSVVSNWQKEAERFTPGLRLLAHQGPERSRGEEFAEKMERTDVVVTSYALVRRDAEMLQSVDWHGVILDEAQNIKNPAAQQSRVAYGLSAGFRLALTGTPVENRLGELWSIMRFLNPGYLGSQKEFRRRFARPIERERDEEALGRLRKLTGPLVLRRLKSDPEVISDLPEKQESKVYCYLTEEQASLYEAVVRDAMAELDESEGIQRKGLVLSMLTSLKQVCNHPAQFLHEGSLHERTTSASETGEPKRSGKLARLLELLEETVSVGDRSLVFTQYAEMGEMLHRVLSERFDIGARPAVQFVHGGTPAKKRTEMVRRFQEDEDGPVIFILSLKAGGTGLNLTRASHVFHFDRWWNPAVEDQATDRAFRIGQTRNVQVHKFVCVGTLEERIDEMLEQKKALAESVVGSDEAWITELSDGALREMVTLRREALA